jgi:hypothetical protein
VLPYTLRVCGFESPTGRAAVLIIATAIMFAYYAIPGLEEPDNFSQLLSRTSLLAIPVIVIMTWRRIVTADAPTRASPQPIDQAALADESA